MWDYASILALVRILPGNRQPYIRQHHANDLKRFFKGPFLPIIEDIPLTCSCWTAGDLLNVNKANILAHCSVSTIEQWDNPDNVVLESPTVIAEAVMQELKVAYNIKIQKKLIKYSMALI